MLEMREGTPEWALAYMEDAARHTLLDEGSGTKELRKAVKIIATALAEAEARGRRQERYDLLLFLAEGADRGEPFHAAVSAIASLATAPAETQKPKTGKTNA